MRVLNVALNPPRLGHQVAPDPHKKYSTADYMKWIPSTGTAARQYTFVANFIGTTMLPVTNLGESLTSCVNHRVGQWVGVGGGVVEHCRHLTLAELALVQLNTLCTPCATCIECRLSPVSLPA